MPGALFPSSGDVPIYARDFNVAACGKFFAISKRRIRWRFGWANAAALAAGRTGEDCRGEEHDVTIIWSVSSGKLLILADGQEVHFSNVKRQVVDHSWEMGRHTIKVVANAKEETVAQLCTNYRQYELFVDGRSFFSFPRVKTLGLKKGQYNRASPAHRKISPYLRDPGKGSIKYAAVTGMADDLPTEPEPKPSGQTEIASRGSTDSTKDEAYLREAVKAISLEDDKPKDEEKTAARSCMSKAGSQLLIDFLADYDAHGNIMPAPPADADEWGFAPPHAPAPAQAPPPPPPAEGAVAQSNPFDQFAPAQSGPSAPPPARVTGRE